MDKKSRVFENKHCKDIENCEGGDGDKGFDTLRVFEAFATQVMEVNQ